MPAKLTAILVWSRIFKSLLVAGATMLIVTAAARSEPTTKDVVNVAIVLDNSGSMAQTDPNKVRLVAARLIVDLLEEGDRIAIISFSSDPQLLAPLTEIHGPTDRNYLKRALGDANPRGDTNYKDTLQLALTQLGTAPTGKGAILFLTDGEIHPVGWDSMSQARQQTEIRAVEDLADQVGLNDRRLFPLSFGNDIPAGGSGLLSDLATRGQGFYRHVNDVSRLSGAFQAIYSSLRGAVFQGLVEVCTDSTVNVPATMRRLIVTVVSNTPGNTADLIPPSGTTSNVEARNDDRGFYKVLIVNNPPPGDWTLKPKSGQCVLAGPIEFYNVRVDWRSPPDYAMVGEDLRLETHVEQQLRVDGPWELANDVQVSAELTRPGDPTPSTIVLSPKGQGSYEGAGSKATASGTYRIDIIVRRDGRIVYGVPPVTHYVHVGDFPKLAINLTPEPGMLQVGQTVAAQAELSGGPPVLDRNFSWKVTGPDGQPLQGSPSDVDGGRTYRFTPQASGSYTLTLISQGRVQGPQGLTNFRLVQERVALFSLDIPQLRWQIDAPTGSTDVTIVNLPLQAAFFYMNQPVRVDEAQVMADIQAPNNQVIQVTLFPKGLFFGGSVDLFLSGKHILKVRGTSVFRGQSLGNQTDTQEINLQLRPYVKLQYGSEDLGTWTSGVKTFSGRIVSNADHPIKIDLAASPEATVEPDNVVVPPWADRELTLTTKGPNDLPAGRYTLILRANSAGVLVDPESLALATFEIPTLWGRAFPFGLGAFGLIFLGIAGVWVWSLFQPRVRGQMLCSAAPHGVTREAVTWSSLEDVQQRRWINRIFSKGRLVMGSDMTDLPLPTLFETGEQWLALEAEIGGEWHIRRLGDILVKVNDNSLDVGERYQLVDNSAIRAGEYEWSYRNTEAIMHEE